jgi:hypothetical protein
VDRGLIFLGGRKFSVLDGIRSASGYQSAIGTVGTGPLSQRLNRPGLEAAPYLHLLKVNMAWCHALTILVLSWLGI